MAALVIDIIVLLIMFFVVYKGFKKGFLYTIIMIIGCILSIFIASKLSVITTNFVYDKYFGENVVNTVNNSSIINSAKELTQEVFDAIPKCESLINKYLGGELETENAFAKILNSEQLGQDASNLIVKPILSPIINTLSTIIIFAVLFLVVKLIASIFKGRLPIIGGINTFLGGAIGVVEAFVIMYILTIIVKMVLLISVNQFEFLNDTVINSTMIFKYFYYFKFN